MIRPLNLLFAVLVLCSAAARAQSDLAIDPAHSFVIFQVQNREVGSVVGRFTGIAGTVAFNPAEPGAGRIAIDIRADSVDTGVAKRDQHLRSPDFLNAAQFPLISFRSTAISALEGNRFRLEGTLSLHGVTRAIALEFVYNGRNAALNRVGDEAQLVIRRSTYGMNFLNNSIGDEVRLTIVLEAAGA